MEAAMKRHARTFLISSGLAVMLNLSHARDPALKAARTKADEAEPHLVEALERAASSI